MEGFTKKRNPVQAAKYTWTRPRPNPPTYPIDDFCSVKKVLSDPSNYRASYEGRKFAVIEPALGKTVCILCYILCLQLIGLKDNPPPLSVKRNEKKKRLSLFASSSDRDINKDGKKTTAEQGYLKDLKAEEKNANDINELKNKAALGVAEISKVVFLKPTPEIATYFAQKTRSLIEAKSFATVHSDIHHVDIVKDVINLLPVHWISHIVNVLASYVLHG